MAELSFRYAIEKDVELILFFIKELAEYEYMLDEVVATEEILKEWIFKKEKAEAIFVLDEGIEGAEPMKDWTVYRIEGDTLVDLAK